MTTLADRPNTAPGLVAELGHQDGEPVVAKHHGDSFEANVEPAAAVRFGS